VVRNIIVIESYGRELFGRKQRVGTFFASSIYMALCAVDDARLRGRTVVLRSLGADDEARRYYQDWVV